MQQNGGIEYVTLLLMPVGFISLFAPLFLIFAVPDITKNLLSNNANFRSFNFQYTAEIIPFIYISAIFGIKNILKRNIRWVNAQSVFLFLLLFAFYAQWSLGALPGAQYASLEVFTTPTPYAKEISNYLATIPKNKRIAATNNLGAHLSERKYIYTIPQGMKEGDYVVFLLTDIYAQPSLQAQEKMVLDLEKNPSYQLEYHVGKFYSFRKL